MKKLSKHWHTTGLCTGLLLLLVVGWASANTLLLQQVAPEDLLPENSFFYLQVDGEKSHQEAYKQTAEYKAFTESGLAGIFKELGETIAAQNGQNNPIDMQKMTELFSDGFVIGASLPQGEGLPIPSITVIVPNAGRAQAEILKLAMTSGENIEVKEIEGRSVATFLIPNSPGIEIGMWAEGKHLVITAGPNSIANTIACATGEAPSISSNEKWEQVNSAELDFDQISLFWLDWKALQNTYGGIPIPVPLPLAEPLTVSTILELVGIDKLDQVISRSGYKGEAIWSETNLVGMTNKNGTTMTLKDLPPLPKVINYFSAFQCDPSAAYSRLIKLVQDSAAIAGPQAQSQVDATLGILPQMIGFDPKADLLDHLGNTVCVYDDPNGGYLGTGTVVCISLDDAEAVKGFISGQLDRLENYEAAGGQIHVPVYPFRVDKNDGSLVVFDIEVSGGITLQYGAVQVIDNWLVISVMPQAVEAFYLRTQNKLATWKPDQEQQTALDDLPGEFTALTVMDTRKTFRVLLNLATPFLPAIQAAAFQSGLIGEDADLPFYVESFPPAELITDPLFPNVFVTTQDDQGTTYTARTSTSMFGNNAGIAAVAGVAVGVALLLPAVQQAREAARRVSSRNNMKQLGLAMHNYHDTHGSFPRGTVDAEDLKPEQRLSWVYSILPFVEQLALYNQLQKNDTEKWNSDNNKKFTASQIQTFLNPALNANNNVAEIHYAGMAGVGKDAPMLKKSDKGAGIFGYNRVTRMRDITDGTSNTIMTTEVNKGLGPWAQGGKSTIRSLTKKPYINGPDGIGGSPASRGVQIGLADGSIRFVSENIDPSVLEALSTIAGGEVIGAF